MKHSDPVTITVHGLRGNKLFTDVYHSTVDEHEVTFHRDPAGILEIRLTRGTETMRRVFYAPGQWHSVDTVVDPSTNSDHED